MDLRAKTLAASVHLLQNGPFIRRRLAELQHRPYSARNLCCNLLAIGLFRICDPHALSLRPPLRVPLAAFIFFRSLRSGHPQVPLNLRPQLRLRRDATNRKGTHLCVPEIGQGFSPAIKAAAQAASSLPKAGAETQSQRPQSNATEGQPLRRPLLLHRHQPLDLLPPLARGHPQVPLVLQLQPHVRTHAQRRLRLQGHLRRHCRPPCITRDSAARVTPRCLASAVTELPIFSSPFSRMSSISSPGCGGLYISMVVP